MIIDSKLKRKRICHLIHEDGDGGGPRVVLTHIKHYADAYEQVLLHGREGGILQAFCSGSSIRSVQLPIECVWKSFFGFFPLLWQLWKLKPDLLILHGQWGAPLGALAGKIVGVKKMLYISHWPAFYTDWDFFRVIRNHLVEALPVLLCDSIVCISPGNLYQYQIRFPEHIRKLIHICNPMDTSVEMSSENSRNLRGQYGWDDELTHVVSVGRLSTQKHVEWLLESWVRVTREVPEARLWIIGDGEESEMLKSLAGELRISGTCTFLGAKEHGIQFINASDIVAMTTLYEGHALIPMEAHLCAKPIVASDVDGVSLSITEGVDGYLVPAGDKKRFSERLITLCRSRSLRRQMGDSGKVGLDRFSLASVMKSYDTLIDELVRPDRL